MLILIVHFYQTNDVLCRQLNKSSSRDMDRLIEFFDVQRKRLSRPVKDLDDIRSHMAALCEIRDAEVRVDLAIGPIEDAYLMLARYGLTFNDGNAERVDSLGYGWRLLRQQVNTSPAHHFLLPCTVVASFRLSGLSSSYKIFVVNYRLLVPDIAT